MRLSTMIPNHTKKVNFSPLCLLATSLWLIELVGAASSNARPGSNNIIQQQQQNNPSSLIPSSIIPSQASNGLFVPSAQPAISSQAPLSSASSSSHLVANNQHQASQSTQAAPAVPIAPATSNLNPSSGPSHPLAMAPRLDVPNLAQIPAVVGSTNNLVSGPASVAENLISKGLPIPNVVDRQQQAPAASQQQIQNQQQSLNEQKLIQQQQQLVLQPKYAGNMELGERSNRCHKSWSYERVIGWVLNNMEKKTLLTKTRLECLQACYNEQSFQCKSFNYDLASGSCQLSDVDRHSLPNAALRRRHFVESTVDTIDYGENNCVQEVRGICDFKPLQNRILKTVDSIYQDIKTEPECRKRCLQAPYRCHSYDLGDSSNPVCRTSHLDRNSLQQIQDPHLEMQGAVSYELDSCYNVTVSCKSREMVARVKTNKLFNGKIYAKNAPLSCMHDVSNSMDFELNMAFQDACNIQKNSISGLFTNEIVIQHNDMVVTNADIGLNLKCQYDLRNQTVYNNINLDDFISRRDPIDIASQSALVKSPNISMQILKHDGNYIQQAQVGDPLMLRFAITDERSPFEIFVRDLYAMDGIGGSEIMLIDGEGCPTDPTIMAAMTNAKGNGQTLEAQFDAFKFPTSETVAFRALVTPCIPHCEPVHCQNRAMDGVVYEAESFGKRRRRRRRSILNQIEATARQQRALTGQQVNKKELIAPEEVVLRNSIAIKDRFFDDDNSSMQTQANAYDTSLDDDSMMQNNLINNRSAWFSNSSLKFGSIAFLIGALLVAQSATLVGWLVMMRRRQASELNKLTGLSTSSS